MQGELAWGCHIMDSNNTVSPSSVIFEFYNMRYQNRSQWTNGWYRPSFRVGWPINLNVNKNFFWQNYFHICELHWNTVLNDNTFLPFKILLLSDLGHREMFGNLDNYDREYTVHETKGLVSCKQLLISYIPLMHLLSRRPKTSSCKYKTKDKFWLI